MSVYFTVTGTDALRAALEQFGPGAQEVAQAAIYQEAEAIMADSKENYVPVDTGTLKNSGYVALLETENNLLSVEMGYGGAAEAYAVVQHERLEFNHPVGGPKYLERPLLAAAGNLLQNLANRIKAAFQ
jgi:hypothetical protein